MASFVNLVDDKRDTAVVLSPMAQLMTGNQRKLHVIVENDEEEHEIYETTRVGIPPKDSLPSIIRMIISNSDILKRMELPAILNDIKIDDTYSVIYNNMISSVMSATSSSRYVGLCGITGIVDEDNMTGMRFSGAKAVNEQTYYFVTLQFHKDVEFLFPVADIYFNLTHYIIPLKMCSFFKNYEKNHIIIKIKRSNGKYQRAYFEVDRFSMIVFRIKENHTFIHPAYTNSHDNMEALINVMFDMDTTGDLIETENMPTVKGQLGTKEISIYDIIALNPELLEAFRIGKNQVPKFNETIIQSMCDLIEQSTRN